MRFHINVSDINHTICVKIPSSKEYNCVSGLPKAAIVSHARFVRASSFIVLGGLTSDDILYTPLPLYHSAAGVLGLGSVILVGEFPAFLCSIPFWYAYSDILNFGRNNSC